METMMAQTALDLSPQQWKSYRPVRPAETHDTGQTRRTDRRRQQAWRVARQAAMLLRDQFGAHKVVVFGSLVHDAWFTSWSDIDLAAWGIPPEHFYGAVAAVTGLSSVFRVDLVDPEACRASLRTALERESIEL